MINRVGKMCVAAMSLCMIVLIVTRKRGDGRKGHQTAMRNEFNTSLGAGCKGHTPYT
jgi:hypothetical protein